MVLLGPRKHPCKQAGCVGLCLRACCHELVAHPNPLCAQVLGPVVACLEWLTFACTHASGPHWKHQFDDAPAWVASAMAKGKCAIIARECESVSVCGNRATHRAEWPFVLFFAFVPGFKTPLGVFVIAGIHVLPIFLYGRLFGIGKFWRKGVCV